MNNIQANNLTISLPPEAHQSARQFAIEQETVAKGKQVYLNTLAIYAVRDFLEELSFSTDLEQGDSWNPAIRCFHDVADLVIPGLGKLECRPIIERETSVLLPKEVRENRIGYVVVRFEEDLSKVELLGFCRALSSEFTAEEIQIDELEPIENSIDYLFRLELGHEFLESDDSIAVRVREKLESQSLGAIIAQFERMIRIAEPYEQRHQAQDILAMKTESELVARARDGQGFAGEPVDEELKELAEELLDKLKEIWGLETEVIPQTLLPSDVAVVSSKRETPAIPIGQWLQSGIAQLDLFIGWAVGEFELSAAGARAVGETSGDAEPNSRKYITRQLKIAGQNYELRILPPGSFEMKSATASAISLEKIEKTWRFQLRNLAPGGFIPGGFKLRLLTEDGQSFEGNEDVAKTAEQLLYVDVTLEANEGLTWETEPFPDSFCREILRF